MAKDNQKFIQWMLSFLLNILANEQSTILYTILTTYDGQCVQTKWKAS
jgi:hypothetical protein